MWDTCYEDYKRDQNINQYNWTGSVEGFSGCEMVERYGWGNASEARYALEKLAKYRESMEQSGS